MSRIFEFRSKDCEREYNTVKVMIELYCHKKHVKKKGHCPDCSDLLEYARKRLARCPQYDHKIACKLCTIHCFREPFKSKIQEVMKFSGPKMIFHHPILALLHLFSTVLQVRAGGRENNGDV